MNEICCVFGVILTIHSDDILSLIYLREFLPGRGVA